MHDCYRAGAVANLFGGGWRDARGEAATMAACISRLCSLMISLKISEVPIIQAIDKRSQVFPRRPNTPQQPLMGLIGLPWLPLPRL